MDEMDAKEHTDSDQKSLRLAKKREAMKRYRAKHPHKNAESCKKWASAHPEAYAAQKRAYWRKPGVKDRYKATRKKSLLKRKYGLTEEKYEELLQITHCPVCSKKFKPHRDKFIDHCHSTGVVRGVLCRKCNLAEGLLASVDTARRLYEYMLRNELFYQGKN